MTSSRTRGLGHIVNLGSPPQRCTHPNRVKVNRSSQTGRLPSHGAEQRGQHREHQHGERTAGDQHRGVHARHLTIRYRERGHRDDDREPGRGIEPDAQTVAPAEPRMSQACDRVSVARKTGPPRRSRIIAMNSTSASGSFATAAGIDRHPRRDEEDRDQEAERQAVELGLQSLVSARQGPPEDEAGGKRAEHDVEVEGHRDGAQASPAAAS